MPTVAPDFTLPALDGRNVTLSSLEGKVRLVDFWATWCSPCREEIPMLNELQTRYGARGFEVLAIAEEEREVLEKFAAENEMRYTSLVGTATTSEAYAVLGLPTAFLLDGEGRIVETFVGPKSSKTARAKLERLIDELLAEG